MCKQLKIISQRWEKVGWIVKYDLFRFEWIFRTAMKIFRHLTEFLLFPRLFTASSLSILPLVLIIFCKKLFPLESDIFFIWLKNEITGSLKFSVLYIFYQRNFIVLPKSHVSYTNDVCSFITLLEASGFLKASCFYPC